MIESDRNSFVIACTSGTFNLVDCPQSRRMVIVPNFVPIRVHGRGWCLHRSSDQDDVTGQSRVATDTWTSIQGIEPGWRSGGVSGSGLYHTSSTEGILWSSGSRQYCVSPEAGTEPLTDFEAYSDCSIPSPSVDKTLFGSDDRKTTRISCDLVRFLRLETMRLVSAILWPNSVQSR